MYHLKTHIKNKPFTCEKCDKSLPQKVDFECHQITHNSEKLYKCNQIKVVLYVICKWVFHWHSD